MSLVLKKETSLPNVNVFTENFHLFFLKDFSLSKGFTHYAWRTCFIILLLDKTFVVVSVNAAKQPLWMTQAVISFVPWKLFQYGPIHLFGTFLQIRTYARCKIWPSAPTFLLNENHISKNMSK